ncbi:MAG: thioesterase family protein [SAR324 cluster bacterium]|nr:thioesterase family protein [SAR324 cluster bacterium]MEE2717262.1 thioesterase family protein [SAR324 cluster bacterium]
MTTPAFPDPSQETRARFRKFIAIPTRWMDNDVYGHVNNVVYYSYFDTAVNGNLIAATGRDIRELPALGIVAETSCRFLQELSFPETIDAGLRVARLGNRSVTYEIGLFRANSDSPAALGRFVHVYVDREDRRPIPIPDLIRNALAELVVPEAG